MRRHGLSGWGMVQHYLHLVWFHLFHMGTTQAARWTRGYTRQPALFFWQMETKAAFVFGITGPFHAFLNARRFKMRDESRYLTPISAPKRTWGQTQSWVKESLRQAREEVTPKAEKMLVQIKESGR